MSMSEFERRLLGSEKSPSPLTTRGGEIPDDFSDDDLEFAQELDSLFAIDKEELPPYYVQTLLASADPRFQSVEQGFEKKTCAHVFRQLNLRRRIFAPPSSPVQTVVALLPTRRTMVPLLTLCLLVLTITIISTGSAFAAGLSFLLSGSHSGVLLVDRPPQGLASTSRSHAATVLSGVLPQQPMLDVWDAAHKLHFPMYRPDSAALPSNYILDNIYLDNSDDVRSWADGPLMELDYVYSSPGVTPAGSGTIAIAEFKPRGKVLQVVQKDSAHQLEINSDGNGVAIYVNGQWRKIANTSSYQWVNDGSSQLIYEQGGVIFWIVGDLRDGVDGPALLKIASSLAVFNLNLAWRMGRNYGVWQGDEPSMLFDRIIYVDDPNNPDGPTLKVIGPDRPASTNNKHVQQKYPMLD